MNLYRGIFNDFRVRCKMCSGDADGLCSDCAEKMPKCSHGVRIEEKDACVQCVIDERDTLRSERVVMEALIASLRAAVPAAKPCDGCGEPLGKNHYSNVPRAGDLCMSCWKKLQEPRTLIQLRKPEPPP